MNKITMKNVSSATVSIISDNFRRSLAPGRVVPITRAIYDDLMFDPGFVKLVESHFLKIDGVSDDQGVIPNEQNVYDVATIRSMLENKDYAAFTKFIPHATAAEKDTVIKLAVEMGITDGGFTALIKKYCGVDVISAINQKHLAEEK